MQHLQKDRERLEDSPVTIELNETFAEVLIKKIVRHFNFCRTAQKMLSAQA